MYDPQFTFINQICTYGAWILGISVIPFFINIVWSWIWGEEAGRNPWNALTLEWQTTSPPAIENFEGEAIVWTGPYDYGIDSLGVEKDKTVEELLTEVSGETS